MARKGDYRSFYNLITVFIASVLGVTKFLIEVNKRGLWKECIVSVAIVCGFNYILYQLGYYKILPYSVFGWSCLISFIAFCVYWSGLFNNSPYGQFPKNSLKRNSTHWTEQQWWWGLDGWRFEQEVAKIFILQGYKTKVTKGSGDGGVDIIITKDDYIAIIQCKHYQNPVPPEPIRALWGCKDDFNADEVILVASSGITQAGADFVSNKPSFRVLNLDDIIRMSQEAIQFEPTKWIEPEKVSHNEQYPETTETIKTQSTTKNNQTKGRRVDI